MRAVVYSNKKNSVWACMYYEKLLQILRKHFVMCAKLFQILRKGYNSSNHNYTMIILASKGQVLIASCCHKLYNGIHSYYSQVLGQEMLRIELLLP